MKRLIFSSIILVLTLTILFAGCNKNDEPGNDVPDVDVNTIYQTLGALAQKEYSALTLAVEVSENGKKLSGTYNVSKNGDAVTVDYSYQQFAAFQQVDGRLVAPENEIETLSGSVTTKDGKVTDKTGAELNISVQTVTASGFDFKKEYFTAEQIGENQYKATVTDPAAFMGVDNVSDMSVVVDFGDAAISKLVINYKQGNKAVVLTYTLR